MAEKVKLITNEDKERIKYIVFYFEALASDLDRDDSKYDCSFTDIIERVIISRVESGWDIKLFIIALYNLVERACIPSGAVSCVTLALSKCITY